jgi:2-polyprenyl-6-methoxyphenol hydroxylase-like FAD-dependent oxidoreductase
MNQLRIAIIGAGVGGLACARGLQANGRSATVFEREPSRHARWQGGMLDLHADTGQAALRAAGLHDQFRALARPQGQELRGLDPISAELVHHELPTADAYPAPEIDRGHLRGLLLDSLSPDTVRWSCAVDAVTPLRDAARLHFADGRTADFDLVVGADGAWSRVRRAVSNATPAYTGDTLIETYLDDVDVRHPRLAALIGPGTLVAKAGRKMLSAQRNSGGHVRVYAGLNAPADWHARAGVNLADADAVREHLLTQFTGWHQSLLDLIRCADGGFTHRPLHVLPAGHAWDHVRGVTLLGDAAHLMPPYGIGANLALVDGTDLATAIATHANLGEAVRAYEDVMLPRSAAAAHACTDLTDSITNSAVIDVDAARRHLNDRLREPALTRQRSEPGSRTNRS